MFNLGNPEDTAKLFLDEALRESGPEIPTVPYDELEEEEKDDILNFSVRLSPISINFDIIYIRILTYSNACFMLNPTYD